MTNYVIRFQYMSEEAFCQQEKSLIINYNLKEKMWWRTNVVSLTMSLFESSFYGMVP